jgi:hypothetical protein
MRVEKERMQQLDLKPELALAQGKVNGIILLCYENERPFQGMLGQLDWRLNGHFTDLLKKQILTGRIQEMLYSPLRWNEKTYHFLIVGAGNLKSPTRPAFSSELFARTKNKVSELQLTQMGVSASDWNISSKNLTEMEDPNLWILA